MKNKVLLGVGLIVILGLMILPGCKKFRFNIPGTWVFTNTLLGQTYEEVYTFVGDSRSGEVFYQDVSLGFYSVSGSNVSFTLEYYDEDDDYTVEVYNGGFEEAHVMYGVFSVSIEGYETVTGSWVAER